MSLPPPVDSLFARDRRGVVVAGVGPFALVGWTMQPPMRSRPSVDDSDGRTRPVADRGSPAATSDAVARVRSVCLLTKAAPSGQSRVNVRTIGKLVSSRDSFHAAEEVHRSTHRRGTRDLSKDGPQAQGQQREGPPRADSVEGRCGRAGVEGPADRRRLVVPDQDGRERSTTMRAGGVRAGAGTETAAVAAGPQAPRRRTGGAGHRPASGDAPEGLRELVVAAVGAPGRRVGDRRVGQPRDHPEDAKKTG